MSVNIKFNKEIDEPEEAYKTTVKELEDALKHVKKNKEVFVKNYVNKKHLNLNFREVD